MDRGHGRARRGSNVFAGLFLVAATLPAAAAPGDCKLLQVGELPVTTAANRIVVDGQVNGAPVRILVDTGSVLSLVTLSAAQRLGLSLRDASNVHVLGIGGETSARAVTLHDLRLGQYAVGKLELPVFEARGMDADLVLGENFFERRTVEFDLGHKVIRLLDPKGCGPEQLAYWAKSYSMADLLARPADTDKVSLRVLLNDQPVDADLDSGSAVSVISTFAARRAGVTHELAIAGSEATLHGFGAGKLDSWVGTFASVVIGDERVANARLRVATLNTYAVEDKIGSRIPAPTEAMPTMLLGADFLMSHRVLVDGPQRKLVFTYEGGPVFQSVNADKPVAAAAAIPQP